MLHLHQALHSYLSWSMFGGRSGHHDVLEISNTNCPFNPQQAIFDCLKTELAGQAYPCRCDSKQPGCMLCCVQDSPKEAVQLGLYAPACDLQGLLQVARS